MRTGRSLRETDLRKPALRRVPAVPGFQFAKVIN